MFSFGKLAVGRWKFLSSLPVPFLFLFLPLFQMKFVVPLCCSSEISCLQCLHLRVPWPRIYLFWWSWVAYHRWDSGVLQWDQDYPSTLLLWFQIQGIFMEFSSCSSISSSTWSWFPPAFRPPCGCQGTLTSPFSVSWSCCHPCFSWPALAFCRTCFLSAPQCIQKLISKFPDVLSSDGFTTSKPCHGVCNYLLTNPGPPVYAKTRRLDP